MSRWSSGRIAKYGVLLVILGWPLYMYLRPRPDLALEMARENGKTAALVRYVDEGGDPGKVRGDLKRRHALARGKLAAAGAAADAPIGALLDALLAAVENRVVLEMPAASIDRASFEAVSASLAAPGHFVAPVSTHLDDPGYECAKGLDVAFQAGLGSDVVDAEVARFITAPDRGRPVLAIAWRARAGTGAYRGANGKRIFPGIAVDAELTLRVGDRVLASFEAKAAPAREITYTTYGISLASDVIHPDWDSNDDEVFGGIVASTCEALGRELVATLAGVAPSATPPGSDGRDPEVAHDETWCKEQQDGPSCARLGVRYRDGVGVAVDKTRAEELLHEACRAGLGAAPEACAPAAALTFERIGDVRDPLSDDRARATLALEEGCSHHAADACLALGALRARPYASETEVSEYGAREASRSFLHACDLGYPEACLAASRLMTPYSPLRAQLLARRACAAAIAGACADEKALAKRAAGERTVFGVELPAGDEPYDIHWATLFDGDETETIWIASRASSAALADRFAPQIHRGTVVLDPAGTASPPPAWASATYLVGAAPAIDFQTKCPPCPHATSGLAITRCTCLP